MTVFLDEEKEDSNDSEEEVEDINIA